MPAKNRSHDGPRFTVSSGDSGQDVCIYDDDFGYDATLELTGDFLPDDKIKYAEAVCDALNAAVIPTADGEVAK